MRTQEFNSKLISLLPLDEVPLHVHRFAARAPCDSKDSEWAAKEKPTPISHFFFSTCCAWAPTKLPFTGKLHINAARKHSAETIAKIFSRTTRPAGIWKTWASRLHAPG